MTETDGDAAAALDALPGLARSAGVSSYSPCPLETVEREWQAGARAGAKPIFIGESAYPALLQHIPDPPPMLWARGDTDLTARPALALVGARNASSLGRRAARALAEGLGAAGHVVVSGLARGIDGIVHAAALETGTIAVVAGGVDVIYPRENADLTARIAESGLILSEMPMGMRPQARHFPRRNRIVAGISQATIVIEAALRSGTLITARMALEQGRDVLAIPGHPLDPRAAGCNKLIRDGATLIRGAEDVLDSLSPIVAPPRPSRAQPERDAAPEPVAPRRPAPTEDRDDGATVRARILSLLGPAPVAEDQLLRDLALPSQKVAGELLELEMEGAVQRQPGGLLALSA
ncbi:DNA-processing protein DprA [Tropicimonas sp. TH_r6]|nr:DNA-processing protein DprA [Tropicimonas sp. TH_r6]MDV7141936.1 DNA-processing protein DprA [Tropicimonas sp. TH_r6]